MTPEEQRKKAPLHEKIMSSVMRGFDHHAGFVEWMISMPKEQQCEIQTRISAEIEKLIESHQFTDTADLDRGVRVGLAEAGKFVDSEIARHDKSGVKNIPLKCLEQIREHIFNIRNPNWGKDNAAEKVASLAQRVWDKMLVEMLKSWHGFNMWWVSLGPVIKSEYEREITYVIENNLWWRSIPTRATTSYLRKEGAGALVLAWESYERNGHKCVAFKDEEQANSHDLFEVDFTVKREIWLTDEGLKDFREGKPVWCD